MRVKTTCRFDQAHRRQRREAAQSFGRRAKRLVVSFKQKTKKNKKKKTDRTKTEALDRNRGKRGFRAQMNPSRREKWGNSGFNCFQLNPDEENDEERESCH